MYLDLSLSYVGMPEEPTAEQLETSGTETYYLMCHISLVLYLKDHVSAVIYIWTSCRHRVSNWKRSRWNEWARDGFYRNPAHRDRGI